VKIHFLGAARTTTGSMYLIEINGKNLLLECGLYQGHRADMEDRNKRFPFDPHKIDAMVLSHAHIDHCGNLPNLVKQGYSGPIHATPATSDLCAIMLIDSAHIQEQDALFVSKIRARKHLPPVEPLYHIVDAEKTVKQFVSHDYEKTFSPLPGVNVTFRDAGHVLGSAQVVLDFEERGRKFRWLFSGDVGRGEDLLLRDPVPVENVDYLQIESTYGNREHAARIDAEAKVAKLVGDTIAQRGKIIIPAFSVGRTQQIVYVLHELVCAGKMARVPIFVDSPLSAKASGIYTKHVECLKAGLAEPLCRGELPFEMSNLTYVTDAAESKKLNDRKEPMVIISASGMAEAGRIRHHLANNIGSEKNLLFFIGYCAEGTLGSQLTNGKTPVNIFGEPHEVKAKVVSMDTYSGHADKNELKAYVQRLTGNVKKIFCIHGEEESCLAHAETLKGLKPNAQVIVPQYLQTVEI
jgi:metallo-beta-lactamase family protein